MVIYTSAKPVKHIGDRTITNVNIIPKGADVRTIKSETVKDYSNRSE